MAKTKLVDVEEAKGLTKEVYDDIQKNFGMIPNIFKAYGQRPEILQANWNKVKAVMVGGKLPRVLKEMIATTVAAAHDCEYCVRAHGTFVKTLGVAAETVKTLIEDVDKTDLDEKEKQAIKFAVKAARTPHDVGEADYEQLKSLGYNEEQIVEILAVMDLFTSFSKFTSALDIEIDFPEL